MSKLNPAVIIGAGGTGKWVTTYVSRAALDYHQRELLREHGDAARQLPEWNQLPDNIDLFAVDVSAKEKTPVKVIDAFSDGYELNYDENSNDFVLVASGFRTVLQSIQEGRGEQDYPTVARWLQKPDADCYNLDKLDESTLGGAGQFRQLGRISLFLNLRGDSPLPNRIESAVQNVSQQWDGKSMVTIFIAGSVAGGTGSGTLIDLAALVGHYARQTFKQNYQVVGYVVLPTTFASLTDTAGDEMVRMQANTYAALRELMRFTVTPGGYEIPYSANLTAVIDRPLFSVLYLVEGARQGGFDLQSVKPWLGTNPAIADSIMLHLSATVDYKNIKARQHDNPAGAFSVMGAVSYIFPAEEMIFEFGHILTAATLEALRWGTRPVSDSDQIAAQDRAKAAAQDRRTEFFESASSDNTSLNRWLRQFLTQARRPQLTTPVMMTPLRFNDKKLDNPLPTLKLEEQVEVAPVAKIGYPSEVKSQTEELMARTVGAPGDELGHGRKPTVNAVLGAYRQSHSDRLRRYLNVALLDALNEIGDGTANRPRRGGLLLASSLLDTIREYLVDFKSNLTTTYNEQQQIPGQSKTRLDRASEEAALAEQAMLEDQGPMRDRLNNHGEQIAYLQRKQAVHDLTIQNMVCSALVSITDDFISITGEYSAVVGSWAASLRDDIVAMNETVVAIRKRRREAGRVQVRNYITEPEDTIERELLAQYAEADNPHDLSDSAGVDNLLRQMSWSWASEGESDLLLRLPEVPGKQATPWKHDDWNLDGTDLVRQAAMPAFAGIRQMTIWDALVKKGRSLDEFKADLTQRSSPITGVDDELQGRKPAIQTTDQTYYVADWQEAQSGDMEGSPRWLSSQFRKQFQEDAVPWNDSHRILGVTLRHLVKLDALSCVPLLLKPYQNLLTGGVTIEGTDKRVPLHLFPGERLAAELEQDSQRLLGEPVTIPTELIGLLEEGLEMERFARVIAYEGIKPVKDRDTGDVTWEAEVAIDGQPATPISFGATAQVACDTFVRPTTPQIEQGKIAVLEAVKATTEALDEASYAAELKQKARGRLLPEGRGDDAALLVGLDRTLRMLLRRQAERLG